MTEGSASAPSVAPSQCATLPATPLQWWHAGWLPDETSNIESQSARAFADRSAPYRLAAALHRLLTGLVTAMTVVSAPMRRRKASDEGLVSNEYPPPDEVATTQALDQAVEQLQRHAESDDAVVIPRVSVAKDRHASVTWPMAREEKYLHDTPQRRERIMRRGRRITMQTPEEFEAYMNADSWERMQLQLQLSHTSSGSSSSVASSLHQQPPGSPGGSRTYS